MMRFLQESAAYLLFFRSALCAESELACVCVRCSKCVLLREQGDATAALDLVQQLIQSTQGDTKLELDSPDFLVRCVRGELLWNRQKIKFTTQTH